MKIVIIFDFEIMFDILCIVCDIIFVCKFIWFVDILLVILVFGIKVVIEFMMIILIDLFLIRVLVILSVCLFVFG